MSFSALGANKDRAGQAGAGELLINPWGRSGGLFGLNCANVTGIEAMKSNIAGLTSIERTEVGFAHTRYLAGTGMGVSNLGLGLNLGEVGVLGVNIMNFGYGDIPITTATSPEGGLGTYKPSFLNLSVGLAHKFSESMSAGLSATYVNQSISSIRASAVGFDAGVEYKSGKRDNLHLGITLRNVGTNIRFAGDGFSFNGKTPDLSTELTVQQRTEKFALPSQLSIGAAYDFYLDESKISPDDKDAKPSHRLTPMFSFISNTFSNDWLGLAVEYAFKEKFMARASYRYENGITSTDNATTFFTGLAAGATFQTNIGENESGPALAIDYAYKMTNIANGVHTVGVRLMLAGKK
jgi:hypothetical protein